MIVEAKSDQGAISPLRSFAARVCENVVSAVEGAGEGERLGYCRRGGCGVSGCAPCVMGELQMFSGIFM